LYATEIFGGMGTLFTPSSNVRGRYVFGIVTEPNGLAQPYLISTNGKLDYQAIESARYTGLLAKATVPVIPVPAIDRDGVSGNIDEFKKRVAIFLSEDEQYKRPLAKDEPAENIHQLMALTYANNITGLDKNDVSIRKLLTKVWPKLKPDGFVSWQDNNYRYLACEASWFDAMINNLQYHITTQLQPLIHGGFQVRMYGLGTVKADLAGLEVEYHPSVYTKFFSKNKAKVMMISDSRTNNDRGYAWMYLYILAMKLKYMMQKSGMVKGIYTDDDYLAFASEMVANKSGYGENSMSISYQGTDITGTVRDEIGSRIATAFPWQDFPDGSFEEVLEFWLLKAVVAARIKALLTPVTVELAEGDRIRAAFDWQMESIPELPGVGSEGQPYMFTPTNRPGDKLFIPMVLMDDPSKMNLYERQLKRTLSTSKVQVKMSEIQGTPLEPTMTKEQFIQWQIENDSRRWEITYPWYKLFVWRFPTSGWGKITDDNGNTIIDTEGNGDTARYQWMLFILSQMAQGTTTYADGYFVHNHVGLYGAVATPYTYGPANPIQQAISDKPLLTKEAAEKVPTTPAPGRVSISETSPATQPPVMGDQHPTMPEAETKTQATKPAQAPTAQEQAAPAKVEESK